MKEEKDYKEDYDEFWKDIVEKDGVINMEQVKKELSDFHFMMQQVPEVYMEVTGGKISKCNTYAFEIINIFQDEYLSKGIVQDDIRDLLDDDTNLETLQQELKNYFDL